MMSGVSLRFVWVRGRVGWYVGWCGVCFCCFVVRGDCFNVIFLGIIFIVLFFCYVLFFLFVGLEIFWIKLKVKFCGFFIIKFVFVGVMFYFRFIFFYFFGFKRVGIGRWNFVGV